LLIKINLLSKINFMKLFNSILFFFFLVPLTSNAEETNILIYGQGSTQVTSEISNYHKAVAGQPIYGLVNITHDENDKIDGKSFRLGTKPLKVELMRSTPISSYAKLVVSSYKFQLEGMPAGVHTLPSIQVSVGGKEYQALPLSVEVQ
jgi:hypothetical protein